MRKITQNLRWLVTLLAMIVSVGVWAADVTDELNYGFIDITGTTYTSFSGKIGSSGAVYAGNSAGGNSSIQLRTTNSNSGIVTTTSGGKVKSITITFNSNTANGRTVDIYGKNTAYNEASDLYNSSTTTKGTKLGSIINGTTTTLTVSEDYTFIGLRSNSNALYIDKIEIVWEIVSGGTTDKTATSVEIDATGLTNANLHTSTSAGKLSATVKADNTTIDGATVSWSSDKVTVATIASDGTVTLVGVGSTIITATYSGNDIYESSSAQYTLNVINSEQMTITFIANVDKGSTTSNNSPDEMSKLGITISCDNAAFLTEEYRFYANSTLSITSSTGNIIKVEFTSTNSGTENNGPGHFFVQSGTNNGSYTTNGNLGTWTGNQSSFELKAGKQVRATQIVVYVWEPPTHSVNWSVNGVTSTTSVAEGEAITFAAPTNNIPNGYEFMGWSESTLEPTNTAPDFITSATMGTNDVTYYAVFAKLSETNTVETKIQTLQYDTWTFSDPTSNKNNYRLFGYGAYIESAAFDLRKLSKVIVYGGTFGGSSYNKLTIGDGTNTWKNVTVSGSSQTGVNTYTDGKKLPGTGKLLITSNSGDGSLSGVRISKVEIFTQEPAYSNYRTSLAYETIDVTDVGWATYVTNNALDFSGMGVTAYIIEPSCIFTDRHQIALTGISEVPAETAILVNVSTGGSYEIPTISDFELDKDNALQASNGTVVGDGNIYVLNQVNGIVGFYPLNIGKTLSAGKAYLNMANYLTNNSSGSVKNFFSFGNETVDAINNMGAEESLGVLYNLNGQRVAAPLKSGIYIMNGKKVFISTKK